MDKTVLVTGANSGIGLETTRALAQMGATLIMACRDLHKAEIAGEAIRKETGNARVAVMQLDLASLRSVRQFAGQFGERHPGLDVLINNAGTFSMDHQETEDGFERTMATNYFGPFLLTHLLLPSLRQAPQARIVNVTSDAYRHGKLDVSDLQSGKGTRGFGAYAASKLALVLFTLELAERLADTGITVNALHPGHVATNIWRLWPEETWFQSLFRRMANRFADSAEEGARTGVYLASSDQVEGVTGRYFVKMEPRELSATAQDAQLRRELWQETLRLVGLSDVDRNRDVWIPKGGKHERAT
jgi:NAD(P)-dependent dehydrogenase (short-subunit alcohol dehydrogenase family)